MPTVFGEVPYPITTLNFPSTAKTHPLPHLHRATNETPGIHILTSPREAPHVKPISTLTLPAPRYTDAIKATRSRTVTLSPRLAFAIADSRRYPFTVSTLGLD